MALVAFVSFLSQTKPIAHSECVVTLHFFLGALGLAGHGVTAKTSAVSLHSCRCLSALSGRSDCFGLTRSETEYWLPFPTRFRGSRDGLEGHTGRWFVGSCIRHGEVSSQQKGVRVPVAAWCVLGNLLYKFFTNHVGFFVVFFIRGIVAL
uniref:Putative secreted protein n=1 Tax=Ixodes ricinus TaxID=34613 RepID=A0A6B0UVE2_IXORI